jgi:thioredoxin reductase (NADPH)
MHETDITIIGAGPVGLFAVFQAGMLGLTTQVADALPVPGGQCAALYPEKPIYDIPGYPSILAEALVENLVAQGNPFHPTYHLDQSVTSLTREGDTWLLTTSKGTQLRSKAVVIAAGCGAFGPNRPPLEGLEAFEGTSVHYMVQKRESFRGKRIVIAGGGDSAVDWALALSDIAEHIYMVHRRPKFRAAPESVARLEALAASGKVLELVVPYQLSALEGTGAQLSAVCVETLEGEVRRLEADTLLAFFGLAMELGPIADWGLNLDHAHITVDPGTCATNLPGIYAIGDIATYPHKLKLILCGFAEAAQAMHAVRAYLRPDEVVHFEYSTTKGVPGNAR